MILDKSVWNKYFKGYTIHDCAIYREKGYCFLLVEEKGSRDPLPATRIVTIIADRSISASGGVPFAQTERFKFSTIACGVSPAEYVVVDTASNVFSTSGRSRQF